MEIFWYRTERSTPHGTILVSHGYAEHYRRFLPLIEAMQASGFDVAAYDHRGHGTSPGRRSNVDVGHLIAAHIDMRAKILQQARTEDLFLFGHSMGGLITAASALIDASHVRGVALSSPAFAPIPHIPTLMAKALLPVARLVPWLPAAPMRKGLLSRDPAVEEKFRADPLTYKGPVPLRTGVTMTLQGQRTLEHAYLMRPPVLILHGAEDHLTSPIASEEFITRVIETDPRADAEFRLIEGARHEILNEPEGPERIAEYLEWFMAHSANPTADHAGDDSGNDPGSDSGDDSASQGTH